MIILKLQQSPLSRKHPPTSKNLPEILSRIHPSNHPRDTPSLTKLPLIEQPNFQWYPKNSFTSARKKFSASEDSLFLRTPIRINHRPAGNRWSSLSLFLSLSLARQLILVLFWNCNRRFNGFPAWKLAGLCQFAAIIVDRDRWNYLSFAITCFLATFPDFSRFRSSKRETVRGWFLFSSWQQRISFVRVISEWFNSIQRLNGSPETRIETVFVTTMETIHGTTRFSVEE